METEKEEQYQVVKSRLNAYKFTLFLKKIYHINTAVLGAIFLISAIITGLLMNGASDESGAYIMRQLSVYGVVLFLALAILTLIALSINIALACLLSLGVRKNLPWLTGTISLLTVIVTAWNLYFTVSMGIYFMENPSKLQWIMIFILMGSVIVYLLSFLVMGVIGIRESVSEIRLSRHLRSSTNLHQLP